jgi:acetyl-CoA synthetase
MITPLPGAVPTKPGSATVPFPGIEATILDDDGNEAESGYLALTSPWPSMLRGIWGDEARYRETYWSKWDGVYFPGDGARKDDDGYFWIVGRVDDVLNVAGHRIGTMEVESALVDHPAVAEAAVVGRVDELKGQAIAASGSTWPSRSARSPGRPTSSSRPTCRRHAAGRSCDAC